MTMNNLHEYIGLIIAIIVVLIVIAVSSDMGSPEMLAQMVVEVNMQEVQKYRRNKRGEQ